MIKKGDTVKITLSNNVWGQGTVLSAENNTFGQQFKESEKESNWYIELDIQSGTIPLGYAYWKEGIDGGYVKKLND